jgi:glutamate racemase
VNVSPIGIFDSGAGGLTVLEECVKLLPREDFIYLSDKRYAPYGDKSTEDIIIRAQKCTERLLEYNCKAVVVACNTATNAAISSLRKNYKCPFIGVEPALKPAYERFFDKKAVLLCTAATAAAPKFKRLYKKYKGGFLTVAPQKALAMLIENNLCDLEKIRTCVYEIIKPYMDYDVVILGCTHYVFVKNLIRGFFKENGRDIVILDGNAGTANRLKDILTVRDMLNLSSGAGRVEMLYGD